MRRTERERHTRRVCSHQNTRVNNNNNNAAVAKMASGGGRQVRTLEHFGLDVVLQNPELAD